MAACGREACAGRSVDRGGLRQGERKSSDPADNVSRPDNVFLVGDLHVGVSQTAMSFPFEPVCYSTPAAPLNIASRSEAPTYQEMKWRPFGREACAGRSVDKEACRQGQRRKFPTLLTTSAALTTSDGQEPECCERMDAQESCWAEARMLRAHGCAGAADGQEPECCERMDAQEQPPLQEASTCPATPKEIPRASASVRPPFHSLSNEFCELAPAPWVCGSVRCSTALSCLA
jgi:hypothetical protein